MLRVTDNCWPELLDHVLEGRLIEPVFQPIVDLARGTVCGYEGLARIHGSPVEAGPAEWFAAAAWHGYTGRMEALALEAVLSHHGALPRNCFLSVNLSPDAAQATEVQAVFERWPDLRGIVVEITEQTPVEDYDVLVETISELRRRGAVLAVDDAGAGYSSIAHLLSLRPEFVKLDRSLITGIDHDQRRAAAVSALGAFAGELDAWIIAEGVEEPAELERLIDLGVPLVQGYLLGRPDRRMQQMTRVTAERVRDRRARRRVDRLTPLARPAQVRRAAPTVVAEMTVLVDADHRPQHVLEPAGGRRANRHPAMCVQGSDDLRNVALRVTGRPSEHRFAALCLCDDAGRFTGLIPIDVLFEAVARQMAVG